MITKGSLVGLKGKKRTATVKARGLLFGSKIEPTALFLEKPLSGCRYWNVEDVEEVKDDKRRR